MADLLSAGLNVWDARSALRRAADTWANGWDPDYGFGKVGLETITSPEVPLQPPTDIIMEQTATEVQISWMNFLTSNYDKTVLEINGVRVVENSTTENYNYTLPGHKTRLEIDLYSEDAQGNRSRVESFSYDVRLTPQDLTFTAADSTISATEGQTITISTTHSGWPASAIERHEGDVLFSGQNIVFHVAPPSGPKRTLLIGETAYETEEDYTVGIDHVVQQVPYTLKVRPDGFPHLTQEIEIT